MNYLFKTRKIIQSYSNMLDKLPHRELICGFLSGKDEIMNWEASDLFQFYYDTKPIKGSLDKLLLHINGAPVDRAIKIGVCDIYHGCVHDMLYKRVKRLCEACISLHPLWCKRSTSIRLVTILSIKKIFWTLYAQKNRQSSKLF